MSDFVAPCRRIVLGTLRTISAAACVAVLLLSGQAAYAQEDSARKILKSMSDYIASQSSTAATFDSDIEVVSHDLQKIQYTSSGEIKLSRPNKVYARRTGGYADVEFFYDGNTFAVQSRDHKAYAQGPAPKNIDELIDRLRTEYAVEAPGAILLSSNIFDELISDVIDAKHVGLGVINGVECEHLAFRNEETDWQIWVARGNRPIPCKFIITSKAVTAAPQYTLRIKEWQSEPKIDAEAFAFKPQADTKKVEFGQLADIDEVPAGMTVGDKP
jgi:hypothetical protein